MRLRLAGLGLLAAAAAAWLALVPGHRGRALVMAEERAALEQQRPALASEVAALERRLGTRPSSDAALTLGPVELRAAVVEALAPLSSAQAVRLNVSTDGAELSLSLFGELDEALSFIDRLTHPQGPAALTRVSLRPQGEGRVQVQLDARQPGAGR